MKILVLLAASAIGFGLAVKDVTKVKQPAATHATAVQPAGKVAKPAAHVVLDTVEITAITPSAIAAR